MSAREWVFVPEPGAAAPPTAEVGGKGHHLARLLALADVEVAPDARGAAPATSADLVSASFRVPRFIVVRTVAFDRATWLT